MAFGVEESLSKRINSLRFLSIVFIVFVHNTVIEAGVNFPNGTQVFDVPLYVIKFKLLARAFTVISLPLFFLISGVFIVYKRTVVSS